MNPELEKLLVALAARDNASPADFDKADAEFERLLEPILTRLSPLGRGDFLRALQRRYQVWLVPPLRWVNQPSSGSVLAGAEAAW